MIRRLRLWWARRRACPAALTPQLPCLLRRGHDGKHSHGPGCEWREIPDPDPR